MANQELMRADQLMVPASQQQIEMQRFLPVMTMATAIERRQVLVQAVKDLMREGIDGDYGVIPGTKKPTLFQPGADKLNNLFGLVPTFEVIEKDQDWTGERHAGEMFFHYEVKCRLMRGDYVMGEGDGSANSWESKYRYRKSERVCPECSKENIRKSKAKPDGSGGGWYCWQKTGGCGATFREGDVSIEGQTVGNKPNPDIPDVVNTIRKMANKRAKIAATLNATSAHEFFGQDLEDGPEQLRDAPPSRKPTADEADDDPGGSDVAVPSTAVADLWRRMTSRQIFMDICAELRVSFVEVTGSDLEYYARLRRFKISSKKDIDRLDIAGMRAVVRDLYESLERSKELIGTPEPEVAHAD